MVTARMGTTLVLVVLTVFNAVLGLRGESKAEASLAALTEMMKNIARVRRDGRPRRSKRSGWCPATSC